MSMLNQPQLTAQNKIGNGKQRIKNNCFLLGKKLRVVFKKFKLINLRKMTNKSFSIYFNLKLEVKKTNFL